jgi:hypothetical protein
MKKSNFFRRAALALAAACALTLAGCPTDSDPEPDSALRGEWTNKVADLHGGLVKDFAINPDFSFEAKINPTFVGAYNQAYAASIAQDGDKTAAHAAGLAALAGLEGQGVTDEATRWTVAGKLTADGGVVYIMSGLKEISAPPKLGLADPGKTASEEVLGFNNRPVKITFTNAGKTAFKFASAESGELAAQITAFFGGDYAHK